MVKYREKETTKEKKMNRLFDTSINVGLRQFYILGIAGSVGNLTGFLGNAYIYGGLAYKKADYYAVRFFVQCNGFIPASSWHRPWCR